MVYHAFSWIACGGCAQLHLDSRTHVGFTQMSAQTRALACARKRTCQGANGHKRPRRAALTENDTRRGMHARTHARRQARTRTCAGERAQRHVRSITHEDMNSCTHTPISIHACMHEHTHTHMRTHTHQCADIFKKSTHVHAQDHASTHARTHTPTCTCESSSLDALTHARTDVRARARTRADRLARAHAMQIIEKERTCANTRNL